MLKSDNTQKRCFVACDEQTKKDGRCSCLSNTHQSLQLRQTAVSISEVFKNNEKMRSKISKKIISETSEETKEKAVEYAKKRLHCKHPIEQRTYIGQNLLRCNVCGLEFS